MVSAWLEISTRDTTCEVMANKKVINCFTWLVCNLQTSPQIFDYVIKIWKWRLLLTFFENKAYALGSFKVLSIMSLASLAWETKVVLKYQKNWPATFDHNSKWVIWAWPEATDGCGFDLKMFVRKFCSLGQFWCFKDISFTVRVYTHHPAWPNGWRYHCTFQENSVNVHLYVNWTLRKVKTKNRYHWSLLSQLKSFSIFSR